MLSFDDERWKGLLGGYRTPFDPRPLLKRLESSRHAKESWHELWENLHHQGDVGEASYAAIPHLVQIHRQRGAVDWNTYAILAVIELARENGKNPAVPEWLKEDYFKAIQDLAIIGAAELFRTNDSEEIRAILSVLALTKDARAHARILLEYSEQELLELEERALDSFS